MNPVDRRETVHVVNRRGPGTEVRPIEIGHEGGGLALSAESRLDIAARTKRAATVPMKNCMSVMSGCIPVRGPREGWRPLISVATMDSRAAHQGRPLPPRKLPGRPACGFHSPRPVVDQVCGDDEPVEGAQRVIS